RRSSRTSRATTCTCARRRPRRGIWSTGRSGSRSRSGRSRASSSRTTSRRWTPSRARIGCTARRSRGSGTRVPSSSRGPTHAGALHATDEVLEASDLLGAGIAKALLGKAAVPDDLPHVTGAIGLLGTRPSWEMMMGCDTLFMIGTSFPYAEFLPKEGQARGVQIDIEPRMLSLRYPMDVALHGDSRETLRALLPLLERKTDRSWREEIEDNVARWWRLLEGRAM